MLDPNLAGVLLAVVTGGALEAYLFAVRPETVAQRKWGEDFYKEHHEECRRLQKRAQTEVVRRLARSKVRQLYESSDGRQGSSEEPVIPPGEMAALETEFDEISQAFKAYNRPRALLDSITENSKKLANALHTFWVAVLVFVTSLSYLVLWAAIGQNTAYFSTLAFFLGLAAFFSFVVAAGTFSNYSALHKRLPQDEDALMRAIREGVHFAEEPTTEPPAMAPPQMPGSPN